MEETLEGNFPSLVEVFVVKTYCSDAGHVQSECYQRATNFPKLTRSEPPESRTVLPKKNVHFEPVNLSKPELDETNSVSITSSIDHVQPP